VTDRIRLSCNPALHKYLPLLTAIESGYFDASGVRLDLEPYVGSTYTQIPKLSSGDLEMTIVANAAPLFQHAGRGEDIRLIASVNQVRNGYFDGCWLVMRPDVWGSRSVRTPRDLKGRSIDGSAPGSPVDFLARQALAAAGLGVADSRYQCEMRTVEAWSAGLRSKTVDVQAMVEPFATQVEAQGLGIRWLSYQDVVPWYQETYLATSSQFLERQPETVERFLVAFLRGVRDVLAARRRWTPSLLGVASKWSRTTAEFLVRSGGLPYTRADASVSIASLRRVYSFWTGQGLVDAPLRVSDLVDVTALKRAVATVAHPSIDPLV